MRHAIAYGIGLALLLAGASTAQAEPEAVTIPLDQIWGYNLPGTRDIAGIPLPEPKGVWETVAQFREQREGVIERMRQALVSKPPTQKALPGFVLPWHVDFYSLQRATAHLSEDSKLDPPNRTPAKKTYSVDDELTLVFFSYPASYYVRLKEVKRSGSEIIVSYQFEPHASVETTVHFALIPLGKLPAGDYRVDFEQLPMDQKYSDAGFALVPHSAVDLVSRPFSFEVWERTDEPMADGTTLIPLDQIWAYKMPGTRDIRKLDVVITPTGGRRHPTINAILATLDVKKRPMKDEKASPGFVVEGTCGEALKEAAAVLTAKEMVEKVKADTELSLVFYSYSCGQYVHIASVEQSETQIRVKYQFVGHATADMTRHFALIAIGNLSPGKVEVVIEQLSSIDARGEQQPPIRDLERLVSDSFSFEVVQ